ncbi:hypothetical protein [Cupriavidus pampae]|uniref:hypothetical protein n=1 Tax=Cupriavidus pampae TaxID=659251 RepID=UPI001CC71F54|nr:hypothetical protein [Cupriavidus pampae]
MSPAHKLSECQCGIIAHSGIAPTKENGAALAESNADVAGWKEGGPCCAALHAAGGAMVAGIGGGNAIAAAVGTGLSSLAVGKLASTGQSVESNRTREIRYLRNESASAGRGANNLAN